MNYNFKNLIKRYTKNTSSVITIEEVYDPSLGGEYIEEETETELEAAIVPLSNDDLKHDLGGAFTSRTAKMYCYTRLPLNTKVKQTMLDETVKKFTILSDRDYSDFDLGLHIYYIEGGVNNE